LFTLERHPPTPGQREHSPQRRTTAGTAAPPPQTRGTQSARQPHSNSLCSPLKGGPGPQSALRHVDAGPSTKRPDARIVLNGTPMKWVSHYTDFTIDVAGTMNLGKLDEAGSPAIIAHGLTFESICIVFALSIALVFVFQRQCKARSRTARS